ncbi:MAG: ribbon-helix-helix protein, CopG family [Nitrososphaerales archaeon]|nr:ribbon-helix-helix protein, CopG family [Nitrososphaerales archaeon]
MSSRTSIQLDDKTKTLLDRIKKEKGASSYAEAIRLLVRDAKRLEGSELGSLPKLKEFHRDKHDRLDR